MIEHVKPSVTFTSLSSLVVSNYSAHEQNMWLVYVSKVMEKIMNMINVAIPHDLTLSVQQGLLVLLY